MEQLLQYLQNNPILGFIVYFGALGTGVILIYQTIRRLVRLVKIPLSKISHTSTLHDRIQGFCIGCLVALFATVITVFGIDGLARAFGFNILALIGRSTPIWIYILLLLAVGGGILGFLRDIY